MGIPVVWLEVARDDLREIVAYIGRDNPQAAEREGNTIISKIEKLSLMPTRGSVVEEVGDPSIRQIVYRHYRIVYKLYEEPAHIEIWRIWHGARDTLELPPE